MVGGAVLIALPAPSQPALFDVADDATGRIFHLVVLLWEPCRLEQLCRRSKSRLGGQWPRLLTAWRGAVDSVAERQAALGISRCPEGEQGTPVEIRDGPAAVFR